MLFISVQRSDVIVLERSSIPLGVVVVHITSTRGALVGKTLSLLSHTETSKCKHKTQIIYFFYQSSKPPRLMRSVTARQPRLHYCIQYLVQTV